MAIIIGAWFMVRGFAVTGKWADGVSGVVFGADISVDTARDEINKASAKGIPSPQIYFRDGHYMSVALADNPTTAQQYLAIARSIRSTAYIVPMGTWCPNPQSQNDFTKCGNQ